MLNIEKFLNNFKVTIQGGIKMVHEWTNEGEGDFCQCSGMEYYNGSFDVDIHNIPVSYTHLTLPTNSLV